MTKRYFVEYDNTFANARGVVHDGTAFIHLSSFEPVNAAKERLQGYKLADEHESAKDLLSGNGKAGYDLAIAD